MIALKCEHIFFYSSPYLEGSTPYSFLKNLANCLGDIPTRYATSLTVKPPCWIKDKPWRHHDTLQLGVVEDSFHNLLSPLHFHCYPFLGWHILVRDTDLQQELRQVTRSRLQFLHTIIQPTEAYQLIHVIEQQLGISVYHLQLFLSPRESLISHQLFNGRYNQRRLEWLCAIDSIYRLATAHRYRLQGFERRYQEWADHQGLPSNSAQR